MKLLEERIPRSEPNSETLKILKNSQIKFESRLYSDFGLDIKRVT